MAEITRLDILNPDYALVEMIKQEINEMDIRTSKVGYGVFGILTKLGRPVDWLDEGMKILMPKLRSNIFDFEGKKYAFVHIDEIIIGIKKD